MRTKLIVEVDLDPIPGPFDSPESAAHWVKSVLNMHIEHYHPEVTVAPSE